MVATQRRHRSSGQSRSLGAGRRCVVQRRQARAGPSRPSPCRTRLRQTPHQDRGPTAGQSAPASRTTGCLSCLGEDGAGGCCASGDSRRLGRQRVGAQATHPQGRGVGEGTRAISIYEEVHAMCRSNNARTHRQFLQRLKSVLPEGRRPLVVADAEFRDPRFRDVEALGWDWVGRIRNTREFVGISHGVYSVQLKNNRR